MPDMCASCYEEVTEWTMIPDCGHTICKDCYTDYLLSKMAQGQECVMTKCIDRECMMIVPPGLFLELLPENMKEKFQYFRANAFFNLTKKAVWCPQPTCDKICLLTSSTLPNDVNCTSCNSAFCF